MLPKDRSTKADIFIYSHYGTYSHLRAEVKLIFYDHPHRNDAGLKSWEVTASKQTCNL